jgi:hypothetical protein
VLLKPYQGLLPCHCVDPPLQEFKEFLSAGLGLQLSDEQVFHFQTVADLDGNGVIVSHNNHSPLGWEDFSYVRAARIFHFQAVADLDGTFMASS